MNTTLHSFSTKTYNACTALVGGIASIFAPAWASRFNVSRGDYRDTYRTFVAGETSGADQHYRPRNRSGDAEIRRGYKWITARVRDQVQNNGQIRGGIKRICNNVVRRGIFPLFTFRDAAGKLDKEKNKQWAKLFRRWAKYADYGGHDSYGSLQSLMLRHMWMDGQFLIHRVYDDSLKGIVPLRLELIECDQMDARVDGVLPNGNIARRGKEIHPKTGRAVAYHILKNHPGDDLNYGRHEASVRIDAKDIIHVYERDRISQSSGISWLAAVVMEAYRMADYREIHQNTARWQSGIVAFLKSSIPGFTLGGGLPAGGQTTPGFSPAGTGTSEAPTEVELNKIQGLPPGTEVDLKTPTHPASNYEPFMRDSQRNQSTGIGMSYEGFTNDYTSSTWASARSGTLEERLGYEGQQYFLSEKTGDQVAAWFIEAAWMAALAPSMPGYVDDPLVHHECVSHQFPGWQWVDLKNAAMAAKIFLELDLDTRTNILAQRGEQFDDVVETLIEEETEMKKLDEVRLERAKIQQEIEDLKNNATINAD